MLRQPLTELREFCRLRLRLLCSGLADLTAALLAFL